MRRRNGREVAWKSILRSQPYAGAFRFTGSGEEQKTESACLGVSEYGQAGAKLQTIGVPRNDVTCELSNRGKRHAKAPMRSSVTIAFWILASRRALSFSSPKAGKITRVFTVLTLNLMRYSELGKWAGTHLPITDT